MTKASAMRRGRIEFYDDVVKTPRCPDCTTATTFYERPFHNCGTERGGWWRITGWDDGRVDVSGPFENLADAERVGRAQAERLGCNYIPATPEEIADAIEQHREWFADQAAARGAEEGGA